MGSHGASRQRYAGKSEVNWLPSQAAELIHVLDLLVWPTDIITLELNHGIDDFQVAVGILRAESECVSYRCGLRLDVQGGADEQHQNCERYCYFSHFMRNYRRAYVVLHDEDNEMSRNSKLHRTRRFEMIWARHLKLFTKLGVAAIALGAMATSGNAQNAGIRRTRQETSLFVGFVHLVRFRLETSTPALA